MYTPQDSSISLLCFLNSRLSSFFPFWTSNVSGIILFVFRLIYREKNTPHSNPGRHGPPACRLPRKPSRHMSVAPGEMEPPQNLSDFFFGHLVNFERNIRNFLLLAKNKKSKRVNQNHDCLVFIACNGKACLQGQRLHMSRMDADEFLFLKFRTCSKGPKLKQ